MMSQTRNRRSGVEDRWADLKKPRQERNHDGTPMFDQAGEPVMTLRPVNYGKGKRWRARYVDDGGKEHARGFARKPDARTWLDKQTAALVSGTHVAPRDAQMTVSQWCAMWLEGYKVDRDSTVRQAKTHIQKIEAEFGGQRLSEVRPSQVKAWVARLSKAHEASYVHALHSRLSQILGDAVTDGLLGRNPCSRKTSPPMGKQKPYVATTAQVWALYDAMPEHLRVAVLLGAFVGLRVAEVSACRVTDVDFIRGVVTPAQQWPAEPLKTDGSSAPIPVPSELTLMLSASVKQWPGENLVTDGARGKAGPWVIERAVRDAKAALAKQSTALPEKFSFHDLRHYLASLLIASGADIKTVQARLRHASARTTLDTYGHLWPDADESTRTAISVVIAERMDSGNATADKLRTV